MLINGSEFIIEERKLEYKTELMLEIAQFSQRHVGLYTCTATNSFGMKENKVRIYGKRTKTYKYNRMSNFQAHKYLFFHFRNGSENKHSGGYYHIIF